MFFYEGYTCPVCGKEFQKTDDIVACPKCGAPHHRECWKLEGHCHYAADHDTERQWKRPAEQAPSPDGAAVPPAPAAQNGKLCPSCGQKNTEYAEFCSRCGKELPASDWSSVPPPQNQAPYGGQQPPYSGQPPYGAPPPYGQPGAYPPPGSYGEYTPFRMPVFDPFGGVPHEETIDGVAAEDVVTFTGANSPYYLPRFYRITHGGSKVSWNWASFFLTPYWLLYRKNFLAGLLVMLFYIAKTAINGLVMYGILAPQFATAEGLLTLDGLLSAFRSDQYMAYVWILFALSMLDILIRVLFGCLGNYVYLRTAVTKIRKLSASGDAGYKQQLITAGGASLAMGAVAYALLNFVSLFINFIFIL